VPPIPVPVDVPTTYINVDDLHALLHSLPQELYDTIVDLVMKGSEVTCNKFFIPQFHIDSKSRAHYLKLIKSCSNEDFGAIRTYILKYDNMDTVIRDVISSRWLTEFFRRMQDRKDRQAANRRG
jgi:hypothetical protein